MVEVVPEIVIMPRWYENAMPMLPTSNVIESPVAQLSHFAFVEKVLPDGLEFAGGSVWSPLHETDPSFHCINSHLFCNLEPFPMLFTTIITYVLATQMPQIALRKVLGSLTVVHFVRHEDFYYLKAAISLNLFPSLSCVHAGPNLEKTRALRVSEDVNVAASAQLGEVFAQS